MNSHEWTHLNLFDWCIYDSIPLSWVTALRSSSRLGFDDRLNANKGCRTFSFSTDVPSDKREAVSHRWACVGSPVGSSGISRSFEFSPLTAGWDEQTSVPTAENSTRWPQSRTHTHTNAHTPESRRRCDVTTWSSFSIFFWNHYFSEMSLYLLFF